MRFFLKMFLLEGQRKWKRELREGQSYLRRYNLLEELDKFEQTEEAFSAKFQRAVAALPAKTMKRWYFLHGSRYGPMAPFGWNNPGSHGCNIDVVLDTPREIAAVILPRARARQEPFEANAERIRWVKEFGAIIVEITHASGNLRERHVVVKGKNDLFYTYLSWLD